MFFVAVFMSYAASLILSLAFEVPIMHMDKILFGEGKRKPRRVPKEEPVRLVPLGPNEEKRLVQQNGHEE